MKSRVGATARRPLRRSAHGNGRIVRILALLCLGLLLASVSSAPAGAQGAGISVIEVPPQFSSINIHSEDGLSYVDVVVSDYNSWKDIFRVSVTVLDAASRVEASVAFQQYATNTTTVATPQFVQPVGSYLVQSRTTVSYDAQPVTIPQRTDMHLTFVLSPVKGQWLNVTAVDLGGLIAYAQVEYQAGLVGGLPTVAGWILAILAALFAVILVTRRIRRDRHGA
jgi:hypothetical protein